MATDSLQVWMGGLRVADLERLPKNGLRCRYSEEALTRWPGNSPLISCSLPIGRRAARAEPFFRGLLPEGRALDALAGQADVTASDTFGLLARFGRDIAGALIISEGEPSPRLHGVERYTDESLTQEIAGLDDRPLGVHDDSELSIAGIQNKLLLIRLDDGSWARPVHGKPSTHILKVDNAPRPGLVEAEAQCLTLAHAVGLTTIEPQLATLGAQQCLIVERFDRRPSTDGVVRIHQEDLSQAVGVHAKYQSRGRGGPGFADAARILDRYATDPEQQLRRLLEVATFTLAIGNADAHGKNLAFIHDDVPNVSIAPLYDTVPTIMWPSLRTDAAMSVAGRFSMLNTDRRDLVDEATSWPLNQTVASDVVTETLERIRVAISDVLPDGSSLQRTLRKRVNNLLSGAAPGEPVAPDRPH